MIPGEYIKTFIPIQELDQLKPSRDGVAPIQPDDLFLMSQISAYTNKNQSAVAVSKKINYKHLSEKISSDFEIGDIKLSVQRNGQLIKDLSNELCVISTTLSTEIELSAQSLSTYIDSNISELSSTIGNNYIQKYGDQTCSLIDRANDPNNPAEFATDITLSDGQIIQINKTSLSDLMAPKHWKISLGGIAVDNTAQHVETTLTVEQNTIECEISNDCYVNCMISAAEYDRSSPIQVWLSSAVDDQSSSSSLYCTLNNSGGFSGKQYFSNYHFSIPVKCLFGAKIILKHENESTPFYAGTVVVWDLYDYYAMTSKDDLSGYVKKSGAQLQTYPSSNVYKIKFNNDGLITNATSVYYGLATSSDAGLVMIDKNRFVNTTNFGLQLSSGYAYTNVPCATSATYGTIKLNHTSANTNTNHTHVYGNAKYTSGDRLFLSCGLEIDASGHGQIFIPCANDSQLGAIKTLSNVVSYDNTHMLSYVGVDSEGRAYVHIPYAHYDASTGRYEPGLIKTGQPDTTDIRVIRNVYLNDQGIACVNVVNQMSIGPFIENSISGYTKCIDVPLNDGQSSNSFKVKEFNGNEVNCTNYGSYLFKTEANVNGWFMAQVIYEGIGTSYTNPSNQFLQIICDGIVVTTIHPAYVQGAVGKKFMYSAQLGVFKGGSENGALRTFGAISNSTNFGNDSKLHFLVKEMSNA